MSKLQLLLGLSFGLCWGSLPLFYWLGGQGHSLLALVFSMGYMWIPGLCALGIQLAGREPLAACGLMRLRPNRWWLVAWIGPPLVSLVALGLGLLMPGVSFDGGMQALFNRLAAGLPAGILMPWRALLMRLPVPPLLILLLQALLSGATLHTLAALGEELAWRGLLFTELADLPFWRASGLSGLIWGLWHAPLILQGHNYPEHPWLGVGMMLLWCLLLAPLFSWIRLKGGSVLATALLHGSLNASLGLSLALLSGGSDLLVGLTGLAGMLVLALLNLVLLIAFLSQPALRHASFNSLAESFSA